MPQKLTISIINNAQVKDKDYFIWESQLPGFGIKICKGGRRSFVCKYRLGRGRRAQTKRMTIGAFGPWTLDKARKSAQETLNAASNGEDPSSAEQEKRKTLTVAELCDEYLSHGTHTKKASTISTDIGRIERHIKPLLGSRLLTDITKADVTRFMNSVAEGKTATEVKTRKFGKSIVKGGKGTATRTVGLLGGIYSYAIEAGLTSINPVKGVKRYKDAQRQDFISIEEFRALGNLLNTSDANPMAISIIKLLVFTGARKNEIQSLKWTEVDFENHLLRLSDSKTGQKIIHLNSWAFEILNSQPKHTNRKFVFPSTRGIGFYQGTPKVWTSIKSGTVLEKYRLHDFRHSFASIAVQQGASLPIIGAQLGHKDVATTQQYAHLGQTVVRKLTEDTGAAIAGAFDSLVKDQTLAIQQNAAVGLTYPEC